MKIFRDIDNTIVVGTTNCDCYILKYQDAFYKVNKTNFNELYDINKLILLEEIKENFLYAFIMALVIIVTLIIYFSTENYIIIDSNFIMANIVLMGNILIHELGHIITLKFFYKSGKVKLGFKMYFIYPAFYVDTSDSYFLPKYKRIAVYLSGNFMNCIYVLIGIFFTQC